MIGIQKLRLFDALNGDADALARSRKFYDNTLGEAGEDSLNSSEWAMMEQMYWDVNLITKKVVAQEYAAKALLRMKTLCDEEGFRFLCAKIPFYQAFQDLAQDMRTIQSVLLLEPALQQNPLLSVDRGQEEWEEDIQRIELCDWKRLEDVKGKIDSLYSHHFPAVQHGVRMRYEQSILRFRQHYENLRSNY